MLLLFVLFLSSLSGLPPSVPLSLEFSEAVLAEREWVKGGSVTPVESPTVILRRNKKLYYDISETELALSDVVKASSVYLLLK